MRLGIKDERVVELFEGFDLDNSGGVDAKEFIRAFYPTAYHEIAGELPQTKESGDETTVSPTELPA